MTKQLKFRFEPELLPPSCGKSHCDFCGASVIEIGDRFCSDECHRRYKKRYYLDQWCQICETRATHFGHYVRKCRFCRKMFQTNRRNKFYCSSSCAIGLYPLKCASPVCGKEFSSETKRTLFCSSKCKNDQSSIRKCVICGSPFIPEWPQTTVSCCSPKCRAERVARRGKHQGWRRRVQTHVVGSETISYQEIYSRDKGVCGLCGKFVDPYLCHPDPKSGSIDHVTPLSRGGSHTRDNVQLSHLDCNIRKCAG